MGRAAIQRAALSLNAKGKGLKAELEPLRQSGIITNDLKPWGDEVRIAGDDAAHPSQLTSIDQAQAEASLEFMDALLEYALALPARRKAKKEARSTSKQSAAESTDEPA